MDQTIARNIIRLRKRRKLTQQSLATRAGLSRSAYRQVEKGRALPHADSLRALARALDVPVRELVTPSPHLENVRFRSLKRMKRREDVLALVARRLEAFQVLEQLLGVKATDPLHDLRAHIGASEPRSAAAVARNRFGLAAREPVHDICGLLESRGVKVLTVENDSDAFNGLSVGAADGGPAIVVNTHTRFSVEVWIHTAAHELGHLLLHEASFDVTEHGEVAVQEAEAETFASHFLMPEDAFEAEWQATRGYALLDRVLKVKRVFRVPWRSVIYRAASRDPQERRRRWWVQMQQEYQRRYGRPLLKLDEPDGVEPAVFREPRITARGPEPAQLDPHDFLGDRLPLLVRQAVEADHITLARGAEILGIPLAEMRERAASWMD